MSKRRKSTISKAGSYRELGEFWDTHDLADYWDQTQTVGVEIALESEVTYYAVEKNLAEQVRHLVQDSGVSAETLLNLWVKEKLQDQQLNRS